MRDDPSLDEVGPRNILSLVLGKNTRNFCVFRLTNRALSCAISRFGFVKRANQRCEALVFDTSIFQRLCVKYIFSV